VTDMTRTSIQPSPPKADRSRRRRLTAVLLAAPVCGALLLPGTDPAGAGPPPLTGRSPGGGSSGGSPGGGWYRGGPAGSGPAGRQLFVGQADTGAWTDLADSTGARPAGGSVYYGVAKGDFDGAAGRDPHKAFADFLTGRDAAVEVGVSWKDTPPGWDGDPATKNAAAQRATRDIAAGVHDGRFKTLTRYVAQHPDSTFHLRLDYEVSSAVHCDSGTDCTSYRDAFRHLTRLIDGETGGGANVRYVYHPVRSEFDKLYPGDDVVDEIGVSIFNQDLCQAFWTNGVAYWNGDQDTTARTCTGYYDDTVNGNRTAVKHGYPADLNVLRMMWWAQQHRKPMIVAESGVQRMSQGQDDQGRQSQSDYRFFMERLEGLVGYRGPLPNGVVDGRRTNFVGTGYDLSGVIRILTFINIDWRYGFDGKVRPDQPFGFGDQDGWFVNGLLSQYPAGRTAFCTMLTRQSFISTCG
jgi:hypothetical protein